MVTAAQRRSHQGWLLELTGIPTAAGCEDRVVKWVEAWVRNRRDLRVRRDDAGNMLIQQRARTDASPLLMTAHMDHPAFVVRDMLDDGTVELEFRGGVQDAYFESAAIEIFTGGETPVRATIASLDGEAQPFKIATAQLGGPARRNGRRQRAAATPAPGDIGRWALRGKGATPTIDRGILRAPACDDLAGVAAALSALDVARKRDLKHVGVLLTVAEEVGFIGAIAACKLRTVPKGARLLCLENSRSFPESPIGGGPIVRVGDKMSVFSPQLTNRVTRIMLERFAREPSHRYQRKLMPGGTCEATTFAAYGHDSTCLCLPLGNYHNMTRIDEVATGARPAKVGAEFISVDDYHGLVEMLVACAEDLDQGPSRPLRQRMEELYKERRGVLERHR